MFSCITMNWRGGPLVTYRTRIELISATETKNLKVQADHDLLKYEKGVKVSDSELNVVPFRPATDIAKWNYTIAPALNQSGGEP